LVCGQCGSYLLDRLIWRIFEAVPV